MKIIKIIFIALLVLLMIGAGVGAWLYYGFKTSNPLGYKSVGEIAVPIGYKRINQDDGFAKYLRALPLKKTGSKVQLFTGGDAGFQSLNYAVVDIPMLSNYEQCADMCMRLRGEYLYGIGKPVSFNDVNGNKMTFNGGSRKDFEKFMRKVYGVASTFSMSRELKTRPLGEIQPGDVFVYAGVDRGRKMGHAVMVVDVAEDSDGDRIFMLAEGATPARECHLVRNWLNPILSPWFKECVKNNLVVFVPNILSKVVILRLHRIFIF